MSLIEAKKVTKRYRMGEAEVLALHAVDVTIAEGEFVSLLGRSGSGKSTLMNLLGGLDRPTEGEISVAGKRLSKLGASELSLYRRSTVGFVFQSFNLIPTLSAWENVSLPMVFNGASRKERRARALELLERVELDKRGDHKPTEMSGGEQQRVAIARALVNDPDLLLCDEPTGNLDSNTAGRIMEILCEAHRDGKTLVMVTHDPALATEFATRTLRMADGKFLEPELAV